MEQQLVHLPANLPSPAALPRLRQRLTLLSERATDNRHRLAPTREMILLGPDSEAEVRSTLREMQDRHRPAAVRELKTVFDGWVRDFPGGQTAQTFTSFFRDIGPITMEALNAADRHYRTAPSADGRQKFFPQPWQIREGCKDELKDADRQRRGVEAIIQALDAEPPSSLSDPRPKTMPFRTVREILAQCGHHDSPLVRAGAEKREPNPVLLRCQGPENAESRQALLDALQRSRRHG